MSLMFCDFSFNFCCNIFIIIFKLVTKLNAVSRGYPLLILAIPPCPSLGKEDHYIISVILGVCKLNLLLQFLKPNKYTHLPLFPAFLSFFPQLRHMILNIFCAFLTGQSVTCRQTNTQRGKQHAIIKHSKTAMGKNKTWIMSTLGPHILQVYYLNKQIWWT